MRLFNRKLPIKRNPYMKIYRSNPEKFRETLNILRRSKCEKDQQENSSILKTIEYLSSRTGRFDKRMRHRLVRSYFYEPEIFQDMITTYENTSSGTETELSQRLERIAPNYDIGLAHFFRVAPLIVASGPLMAALSNQLLQKYASAHMPLEGGFLLGIGFLLPTMAYFTQRSSIKDEQAFEDYSKLRRERDRNLKFKQGL